MIDHKPGVIYGTTIVSVRKKVKLLLQAMDKFRLDQTIMKGTAKKIRKLSDGSILGGFAGATADAFTFI